MHYKALLMSSVSIIAVGALSTHAAQAQGPVSSDNGYTVSVEGAMLMGPGGSFDKTGSSVGVINLGNELGYDGAISIGKQIDPAWDVRVGGGIMNLLHNSASEFVSGSNYGYATDFSSQTVDLEAGYAPHLDGNLRVRLSGGVRALHFMDSVDKSGFSPGSPPSSADIRLTNEFLGLGPRVGLDASTRFGDSNIGISGMVAGAAIFGQDRSEATASVTSGGSPFYVTQSGADNHTVYDLEAALGLDYFIGDTAKVTLGYKVEQLWNVRGSLNSSSPTADGNQFLSGPFAKLEAKY